MMRLRNFTPALLGLGLLGASALPGCVAARKYNDLQARQTADAQGKAQAERQYRAATAELQKTADALAQLRFDNKRLEDDSLATGQALRQARSLNHDLNNSYDRLLANSGQELASKSSDYNKVAKDLARREAELGALDAGLRASKADNDRLAADLQTREARLAELTQALADKDRAVNDLKARVSKALQIGRAHV